MITLSEVAKAAGVSRSAVSKALLGGGGKTTKVSEKNIIRIRETAARLGYRPNLLAQRLANKRQDIIGVIIDSQCCGLYNNIMSTIEHLTFNSGCRLQVGLVHDSYDAIKKYVDDLLGYNIQSVICLAHYYSFAEQIPPLFKPFRNALFISKPMTEKKFSFVSPDYYAIFYEAVEYLLKLNHRRIVFAKTNYDTYDARARAQAFHDAHRACGVEYVEKQIYKENVGEIDTPELMDRFLSDILPLKPDALIMGNGIAINWCIRQLRERNLRVPEDISIIGMDDWSGSQAMTPSITVMNNNYREIARQAVQLIQENAQNETPQIKEIFIRGQLVLGESCTRK